ncbi:MAG TPA: acyl--CoA ligase [Burkholderiaceae bacterium]
MHALSTLAGLLGGQAGPDVAIRAPERPPLTYEALRGLVSRTVLRLNELGIGRGDRIGLVLPNGAEAACAFLAVASGATAAPLNPAYRDEEFEFYLADLRARAVVVQHGTESPALAVAQRLGLAVLELVPSGGAAGGFTLEARARVATAPGLQGGSAASDDVALILHTSGTTSRPKIVPLTHGNICASARNVAATLHLNAGDCGLQIMPLFHIHDLVAGLLAPLAAGSSVYCAPGFHAFRFFAWMADARATWYTAVPTMHQAILARAHGHRDVIAAHPLRLIRSSSASMPPALIREIEQTFGAPLIESYGMTESAHQMASNPLPPGRRIAGSVGLAAGPQIALMDEAGRLLPAGQIGEIVVRGPTVTVGYENNPKANQEAFTDSWFRTGDQGRLDADGYLTITGRLKEIINRGGEKVSPREVDEVLMDHPAVAQAVTFAVPHERLGEDVAAAVVLKEGAAASERELREFAARHLADFKVPRKIVLVPEIRKGATGKLQRIGLAQALGLA